MRGFGYLISIVSVVLLGLIGWPKPEDPGWHLPALLGGMALSIAGMGLRWLASRQQRAEIKGVERRVGIPHPAE
jgi:hypothetical protein